MTEQDSLRVVVIEDSLKWQERCLEVLGAMGATVVAVAENMLQATQEVIPKLEALGVQFVLLDGNLHPSQSNGADGLALAAQIRKQAPSVRIIGFSSAPQQYVDIDLGKGNFNQANLTEALLGKG